MIHSSAELQEIALQWVDRCATLLSANDWEHIRRALDEMHDQLREDVAEDAEFDELFADLVAGLIDRLGNHPVACLAQARIYMFSAEDGHRAAAAAWMQQNRH
jgi:hypothetical protein